MADELMQLVCRAILLNKPPIIYMYKQSNDYCTKKCITFTCKTDILKPEKKYRARKMHKRIHHIYWTHMRSVTIFFLSSLVHCLVSGIDSVGASKGRGLKTPEFRLRSGTHQRHTMENGWAEMVDGSKRVEQS